ncbi:hypothetical protein C0995_004982 [Termitomyces sp. Mi166|nr:hypothetical protein C0995_004982 [Termitomyces sp. Mi166\
MAVALRFLPPQHTISAPWPLGLPLYLPSISSLISHLFRILASTLAMYMTSFFVVLDIRRHDHPIVYRPPPTLYQLTGHLDTFLAVGTTLAHDIFCISEVRNGAEDIQDSEDDVQECALQVGHILEEDQCERQLKESSLLMDVSILSSF